jgi:hypothetical protein
MFWKYFIVFLIMIMGICFLWFGESQIVEINDALGVIVYQKVNLC